MGGTNDLKIENLELNSAISEMGCPKCNILLSKMGFPLSRQSCRILQQLGHGRATCFRPCCAGPLLFGLFESAQGPSEAQTAAADGWGAGGGLSEERGGGDRRRKEH